MYKLERLNIFTAWSYHALTFPSFQPLLYDLSPNSLNVAIGAYNSEEPVGLALAIIMPEKGFAKVGSIFVKPSYRRQGIGTALLMRLEEELYQQRGCTKAKFVYATGKLTTTAIEHLLQNCNWLSPEPEKLICKCNRTMLNAPWLKKYTLPDSFTIFPWVEITPTERVALQKQQEIDPWIPESLMPLQYENDLEPLNSVGLRYEGQVVGWVITQRFLPHTICYSCSYIRPDLQKRGRIIPLYAEAIKRQAAKPEIPNATWVVPFIHEPMVQFVKQRMANYMTYIEEFRSSFKLVEKTKDKLVKTTLATTETRKNAEIS